MIEEIIKDINVYGAKPELLVALFCFVSVVSLGTGVLFFREWYRSTSRKRRAITGWSGAHRRDATHNSRLLHVLEQIGNVVSHGHASTNLWEQLIRAGYLSRAAPAVYTGIKILMFIVGLTAAAILVVPSERSVLQKTGLISIGAMVLFFLPNLVVLTREKKRREEIRQHLPDVVDLLEICVSSGIGLDMAWNMVAHEVHHVSPVLATAMDLSNFEIHLGASRTDAMRNMAMRTGADQLSSLAAILVQSERFGTSVAVALREFAASMREERRMLAEEGAEKMAVKLIIPMVLFIFPAVILVTVGPAAIKIASTLLVQG
jgi:tight adherence protein C